jgi:hypothetical protein
MYKEGIVSSQKASQGEKMTEEIQVEEYILGNANQSIPQELRSFSHSMRLSRLTREKHNMKPLKFREFIPSITKVPTFWSKLVDRFARFIFNLRRRSIIDEMKRALIDGETPKLLSPFMRRGWEQSQIQMGRRSK